VLKTTTLIQPETLVRWHRAGFQRCWCWKSRSFGGRPQIDADLCALIRQMSLDNPLWGAPAYCRPLNDRGPTKRRPIPQKKPVFVRSFKVENVRSQFSSLRGTSARKLNPTFGVQNDPVYTWHLAKKQLIRKLHKPYQ
jgi:hypothetical protein